MCGSGSPRRPGARLRRRRGGCSTSTLVTVGNDLGAAFLSPADRDRARRLAPPVSPLDVRVEMDLADRADSRRARCRSTFGIEPHDRRPRRPDRRGGRGGTRRPTSHVVVVGTNSIVESEGYDRRTSTCPAARTTWSVPWSRPTRAPWSWSTPGRRCCMPWRDDVAAIVIGYFGGQEFGDAIADVLTRRRRARRPAAHHVAGAAEADVPVLDDHARATACSTTPRASTSATAPGCVRARRRRTGSAHGLGYTTCALTRCAGPDAATPGEERRRLAWASTNRVSAPASRSSRSTPSAPIRPSSGRCAGWSASPRCGSLPARRATVDGRRSPTRLLAYWQDGWPYEPGEYTPACRHHRRRPAAVAHPDPGPGSMTTLYQPADAGLQP